MTTRLAAIRRRSPRPGPVRGAQSGTVVRGVIVAAGLVAAVMLQVAGSRLQCRLADLVGIGAVAPIAAPVPAPGSTSSCGSPSGANPMHSCKVAVATTGIAPVV